MIYYPCPGYKRPCRNVVKYYPSWRRRRPNSKGYCKSCDIAYKIDLQKKEPIHLRRKKKSATKVPLTDPVKKEYYQDLAGLLKWLCRKKALIAWEGIKHGS